AAAARERARPSVIFAHTLKGWGLPFAGDPLNHTMVTSVAQIEELRAAHGVTPGQEWAGFAPDSPEARYIAALPPLFSPPPPPARARDARGALPRDRVHAGGIRPRAGRARPAAGGRRRRDRLRRRRDHHAPGRLDESQGRVLPRGSRRSVRRRPADAQVARGAGGPTPRARDRRAPPLPPSRPARPPPRAPPAHP